LLGLLIKALKIIESIKSEKPCVSNSGFCGWSQGICQL